MTRVLHWNGRDLPAELRDLPPGDYVISPVDAADDPRPGGDDDDDAADATIVESRKSFPRR